jgi:hypothetical protein
MERQQAQTLPSSVRITPPQPDLYAPFVQRTGYKATNLGIAVQICGGVPNRPFVQLERAQPSEGWDSGSNPERPTKRAGGRPARHLTVAQDHAGSTPVSRARIWGHRRVESRHVLTVKIASSNLAGPAMRVLVASGLSRPAFNREIEGSNPSTLTKVFSCAPDAGGTACGLQSRFVGFESSPGCRLRSSTVELLTLNQ